MPSVAACESTTLPNITNISSFVTATLVIAKLTQCNYFESDIKLADDHPDMDWTKESNAINALRAIPRHVEPAGTMARIKMWCKLCTAHGKHDFPSMPSD